LSQVWKDDTYSGGFLQSVMVVGVSKNALRSKMFEDGFVSEFEKNGVRAVASAAGISSDKQADVSAIRGEAQKLGIQAIFVSHMVRVDEKAEFVHSSAPPPPEEGNFEDYYGMAYDYTQYPGRYKSKKNIYLKSNLYEASTEKLIWSMSSETVHPKTVHDLLESVSDVIMENLRESRLIR